MYAVAFDLVVADTLAFLAEVRDYIARWPAHSMNRDMLAKIEAHLDDPLRRLIREGEKTRGGSNYTPAGQKVIEVSLSGDSLTITAPPRDRRAVDDWVLLHRLRNGEKLTLVLDPDTQPVGGGLSPSEVAVLRRFTDVQ
jgi:hypothetical protein